jgi:hypothetical protein
MLDTKKFFPKSVWERTPSGKWSSRPVTKADQVRREQLLFKLAYGEIEDEQ